MTAQRRTVESVSAWIAATLAACTVWLVVLLLSFRVLPPGSPPSTSYSAYAELCGTALRPRDGTTGCADAISRQRWLIIVLVGLVAASLGVSIRYGPRSLRAAKRTSTIVVAVCFTLAAVALTGMLAVSNHYTQFSHGDSAWTDSLDYHALHRTAYTGGIVLLVVTLATVFLLGVARILLPLYSPPSRR